MVLDEFTLLFLKTIFLAYSCFQKHTIWLVFGLNQDSGFFLAGCIILFTRQRLAKQFIA